MVHELFCVFGYDFIARNTHEMRDLKYLVGKMFGVNWKWLDLRSENIDIMVHDGEQKFFEHFTLMFFDSNHTSIWWQFEDIQLSESDPEAARNKKKDKKCTECL